MPLWGAILGGAAANLIGGYMQGQQAGSAQQRQQGFLEDVYGARSNDPMAQRIRQLLGIGGGGGRGRGGAGTPGIAAQGAVEPRFLVQGQAMGVDPVTGRLTAPRPAQPGSAPTQGATGGQAATPYTSSLADAIARGREVSVMQGQQMGEQGLLSALGRSGAAGGGQAARAIAAQRAGLPGALAGVEAGRLQMTDALRRQEISDLMGALQVMTPTPGAAIPGLAQSLGQTGYGMGRGLSDLGTTIGTWGLMQSLGMFGNGGAGRSDPWQQPFSIDTSMFD